MVYGVAGSVKPLQLRLPNGTVPLGFVQDASVVYLVARSRSAQWPAEILRDGRAELVLTDRSEVGTPELVTIPDERARILELFRAKYGGDLFARWYERPARVLRVRLRTDSAAPGAAPDAYYDWLRAEFDNVADDYDRHITGNRINLLLRNRSLSMLTRWFATAHRILEIGCGSGMETLPLLEQGHEVVAVDISARMLETVRRKAEHAGVSERLTTRELAARDLEELADDGEEGSFDGAFSTFGALNCEPDLSRLSTSLFRLLRPGTPFLAGVFNRWCLFEMAGYSLTLRPRRMLGRQRNPVRVGSSRFCVDVYSHSVRDVIRLFRPGFRAERIEGVPVLLPPSDLVAYADRFDRRFEQLAAWDARVGAHWPFSWLGDHFLVLFMRES